MKDISTHDHVQRLCIAIERRVRADCIVRLQPSGPHASSLKARQREERAALTALNRHLKDCVSLVNKGLITVNEVRARERLKKIKMVDRGDRFK